MKLAGDYLGEESPMCCSMETWYFNIDRFERQYSKAFSKDPLFRADLIGRFHKRIQVFLNS